MWIKYLKKIYFTCPIPKWTFKSAISIISSREPRLDKRVRPSLGPSVGWSIGNAFVSAGRDVPANDFLRVYKLAVSKSTKMSQNFFFLTTREGRPNRIGMPKRWKTSQLNSSPEVAFDLAEKNQKSRSDFTVSWAYFALKSWICLIQHWKKQAKR